MAKYVWGVLCERIITDRETNSVSYIDCSHAFATKELPAPVPALYLGTLWEREEAGEKLRVRVLMVTPHGKPIFEFETPEIPMSAPRHRVNVYLNRGKVEEFGRHTIRIERRVGEEYALAAELPLQINQDDRE